MKKIKKFFLPLSYFGIVLAVLVLYFVMSPKDLSQIESRQLQHKINISFNDFYVGKTQKDLESYLQDQFFMRDFLIRNIYRVENYLGKKMFNGVLIGKEGVLLFEPELPKSKEYLDERMTSIIDFKEKLEVDGIQFVYAMPPNHAVYFKDYYPYDIEVNTIESSLYMFDQLRQAEVNVKYFLDDFNQFNEMTGEHPFHKIDHHYNYNGFKIVYEWVFDQMNDTQDLLREDVEFELFCNTSKDLIGTLSKHTHMLERGDETFCNYIPSQGYGDFDFYSEGVKSEPHYEDIYGDWPSEYWQVYNTDVHMSYDFKQDGPNLLIIKDCFANPLSIMLAQHFNKTFVYDPRYPGRSLEEIIEKENIDSVLLILNDTHFEDIYFEAINEFTDSE